MKKIWIIGIIGLAAALTVGVAFAQSPTPAEPGTTYGQGMMGGRGGYGMMGQGSFQTRTANADYGPMHEYMVGAFAEAFGISTEDLNARLASGESMWQVAESLGYSTEDFTTLRLETRAAALQQAVEAGIITPEQAEWMNERMSQMGGFGNGTCDHTGTNRTDRPSSGMRGYGMRGARAASSGG